MTTMTAVGAKYVVYYRSGTQHDLGAQARCVESHAQNNGAAILASFQDDESSRRPERPELARALLCAKQNDATLVVATLKGLARDRRFLTRLKESCVPFLACDLPDANSSTVSVLAALADYEAYHASQRAKNALAKYKARGGKLGAARPEGRKLSAAARIKGAQAAGKLSQAKANDAYRNVAPRIHELRKAGRTLQEIAARLNADGHLTRRDRPWNAMQVSRVLKRYAEPTPQRTRQVAHTDVERPETLDAS